MIVDNQEEEEFDLKNDINALARRLRLVKWNKESDEMWSSLCNLAKVIGKLILPEIEKEKVSMSEECKSYDALVSLSPRMWYAEQNPLLLSFLEGFTNVSSDTKSEKKLNSCIQAIEQIIYT